MIRSFLLALLTVFYLMILPQYIQGGDTSELVNASHHLFVPHPPGYPLYLWTEHFWTNLLPFSTVFWRASLLSALWGVFALTILGHPFRKRGLYFLLLILTLGLKEEFIEASVLPDVFSLHALLVASIGFVFLFVEDKGKRAISLPILLFMAFANHHTSIFLLPCYFFIFYQTMKDPSFKKILSGTFLGVLICSALYLSLLLCQAEHPLSWGSVTDFSSLVGHVLRRDYGTFQLASGEGEHGFGAFFFLIESLLPYVGIVLMALYLVVKNKLKEGKFFIWSFCLLLSLAFPLMMNIAPDFIGAEILKRFHVMPMMVLASWLVYVFSKVHLTNKAHVVLLLSTFPVLVTNFMSLTGFMGLRDDSIIEDYSRNLYELGKKVSPSVIVADNDSSFFGIRYVQAFDEEGEKSKVSVVTPPLFFHPWFVGKVKKQIPAFKLQAAEDVFSKRNLNLSENVVRPNLANMNFVMVKDYKIGDWYKVTFHPLGRTVEEGSGVGFAETKLLTSPIESLPKGPQHSTKAYLHYQYSHFYLAQAVSHASRDDLANAQKNWEEAVRIVPYAWVAMEYLCQVNEAAYPFCGASVIGELKEKTRHFIK